ncbi:SusC/RagA family TonB-linked outer membrane protein [Pedobacter sp. LMG 31464]|uniref:SusC/RagA family TonB-linked outer membrane protein n=1 Tax=Pedobacter planticolens TaxID=2679964 RepID=A0A923DW83_9SPHI|nr:SusC/RagA family TonB-linked outer membrane protein [Pedobacter planticolens]MBB2145114.1 SusC/RagA family TonB-linked outer membrane protein [Pedobacter planticolens]
MKKVYLKCLSILLLTFLTITAFAQKTITGTVRETSGPLPGVSVFVKGTSKATQTDANGKFSIVATEGNTLVFTYLGYGTKETIIGSAATVDITLTNVNNTLTEVVVTALGIKREKKSLGYAVQEVKGETLVEAKEPNLVNALTGKVAGLQISRSSNGPAGSSKITLRGNNSLTGSNQPLIVVDGIPLDNFTGATNNDYYNPTLDMGNGMADINADDIETMTVLKGPSAAALYGSRAGNGAILITTKSGKAQAGLGITITSSLGIESLFTNPNMQNDYAQGSNNIYDPKSRTSWGPKVTGQSVTKWDGSTAPLTVPDNIGDYFGTGLTSNQGISFQQQYKSTSVYTSFNRLDDKSMIPGAKLTRNNLMAKAVSKFGKDDRWTLETKIQYINSNAQNRPQGGPRGDNTFYALYLLPRTLPLTDFKGATDQNNKMLWYNGGNEVNPYWGTKYNLNQDIRDRFLLNGGLKYEFTDWLNAEIKAGSDIYTTNADNRTYAGQTAVSTGKYGLSKSTFSESNYSALITARKDNVFGKLGGVLTLGGNLMSQKNTSIGSSVGALTVPDLFSVNNGTSSPSVTEGYSQKAINSVYGSVGLNYDGYLFVDGTFRNDWSSTLSPANRSFFYPSVSVSYVFTEMFSRMNKTLPSWISYGKLRASYASVGNDLSPYQLYNTFSIGKDPLGSTTAGRGNILFDPNVKSELIKSYEAGLEMRFFKSRVGFDLAIYKSNATQQLINLPMDGLSGYTSKKINAGDIENKGIEVMLDGRILNNPNSFNWNVTVNYSANKNVVNSISKDVTTYALGGYDDVQIMAVAGQKYGEIYGSHLLRVNDPSSQYNGQLILRNTGLPQKDPQNIKLGNQQATGLLGVTNAFSYKGVGLSFLVDARFGGKIFSGTLADMQQFGTASNTVTNGLRDDILVDGVVLNTSTNTYEKNTVKVSPQNYWGAVAGANNLGITEANLYDASNIRLRNVQLSYDLPRKFFASTPIQRVKIGASCNNVWLIKSHMNGLDPESIYATGTNATGFENGSAPTTRTFLFNLTVGF